MFSYFWFSMLGLFITTLYYRMNKGQKIAVSIAVPVFLIFSLDAINDITGGQLGNAISGMFAILCGMTSGCNPYIGMLSMFIFAAVGAALVFALVRKADIKR